MSEQSASGEVARSRLPLVALGFVGFLFLAALGLWAQFGASVFVDALNIIASCF